MPKRRSSSSGGQASRLLWLLAGLALVIFLGGECFAYLGSDSGRLALFRTTHLGDHAHVVRVVGKHLHAGLKAARVPDEALHEEVVTTGGPTMRWTVSLPRDGAPMQVNYALTRALEEAGATVLSGSEAPGEAGALTVTLLVGVGKTATHEVVITRPGRPHEGEARPARIALVLQGDDADLATVHDIDAPFAVAAPATGDGHERFLRDLHHAGHEIVLMVPMEPENYPRVNPGPGTLLVSMSEGRIRGELTRMVREGEGVVAVANLLGSFATQDESFVTSVYRTLKGLGLPFLHLTPAPRAVCKPLASRMGVAYDEPDVALVDEARAKTTEPLEAAWTTAIAHAHKHGAAIVLVRVTPLSAPWLPSAVKAASAAGVTLVPLSGVIHHASPL